MVDVRIILSALWGSLMLVFLLGDVLRIFAGDYKAIIWYAWTWSVVG